MKAPRSFLKLPAAQLIKVSAENSHAPSTAVEKSHPVHELLNDIRSQAGELVLRAETFTPILRELSRSGLHEQASKVVLEMVEQRKSVSN
jgi:hypothetical protein